MRTRCIHGYGTILVVDDEGWRQYRTSRACPICPVDSPVGPRFCDATDPVETSPPDPPNLVRCREVEGCVVVIAEGEPHSAPCLLIEPTEDET